MFFLDRSLGKKVAVALTAAGAEVVLHNEYFPDDAPDQDWLLEVGRRGWVVLTKDEKIRTRTLERQALIHAGVKAFIFTSDNITWQEMSDALVKALPAMHKLVATTPPPFLAKVYKDGRVDLTDLYE